MRRGKMGGRRLAAHDKQRASVYQVSQDEHGTTFSRVLPHQTVNLQGQEQFITVMSHETPRQVWDRQQALKPKMKSVDTMYPTDDGMIPMGGQKPLPADIDVKQPGGLVKAFEWEAANAPDPRVDYDAGVEYAKNMDEVLNSGKYSDKAKQEFIDFTRKDLKRRQLGFEQQRFDAMKEQYTTGAMTTAVNDFAAWEKAAIGNFRLQPNECSRLHKLIECLSGGISVEINQEKNESTPSEWPWEKVQTFVVKHDWAGVMGEHANEAAFVLPFPECSFEFKVNGKVFIVLANQSDDATGEELNSDTKGTFFVECTGGVWLAFNSKQEAHPVFEFLWRHILAMCVVLEAEVAEHTVVRQPYALNVKRQKAGKRPLSDYHVVDLSRRHRAVPDRSGEPTGRRVRMHFRRGHWRHFPDHKTWIKWMLVGNPDLGFVDKEYKL